MISGPIRGLKKTAPDGADTLTDGHGDSMTEWAQWGGCSEKNEDKKLVKSSGRVSLPCF